MRGARAAHDDPDRPRAGGRDHEGIVAQIVGFPVDRMPGRPGSVDQIRLAGIVAGGCEDEGAEPAGRAAEVPGNAPFAGLADLEVTAIYGASSPVGGQRPAAARAIPLA